MGHDLQLKKLLIVQQILFFRTKTCVENRENIHTDVKV